MNAERSATCKQVIVDLLAEYLEGALDAGALQALDRHLERCPPCVAYLRTLRATRHLTARAARPEMPEEMRVRLRAFLLEQIGRRHS